MATSLEQLVQRADLDGLVRHVDDTCAARDWDHLVEIRNQSRAAVNTGRQLWPIATLANFRLALWAPAHFAVRALDDTARTFMPGPVAEILAVHHSWEEMSPFLDPGHDRGIFAYERALRGDIIDDDEPEILDIPIARQPWEPLYRSATYNDSGVVDTAPHHTSLGPALTYRGIAATPIDDIDTIDAFRHMMDPWTAQSNGVARIAVVEGGVEEVLGAIGLVDNPTTLHAVSHLDAWEMMTWAASSGGAHGKRRGTATGRSDVWWMFANFVGIAEPWPANPDECGDIAQSCDYFVFTHDKTPTDGWGLHLIIIDSHEGRSVALDAHDRL